MARPPGQEGKAKVLTATEFQQVCSVEKESHHGLRNVALLHASYFLGLRAKELAGLTVGDVMTPDRQLKMETTLRSATTKGNKVRQCYLTHPKLRQALTRYLDTRPACALTEPLFLSQKKGPMTANSVQMLFSKIYQDNRLHGATSHSGRRTFATRLLNHGANIKELQTLMGHKNIQTTSLYVEADPHKLANLVNKLR